MMSETNVLKPLIDRTLAVLGIAGILALYVMALRPHHGASDFSQIYLGGLAWRHGVVPYGTVVHDFGLIDGPSNEIFKIYYYLPLCGMLAVPLSLLPYTAAATLWRFSLVTLLLYSLWRFSGHVLPHISLGRRLLLLGVTSLAGSVRWIVLGEQPTGIIVPLLVLFFCMALERRWTASVALAFLISIKPTYLLPVIGIWILCRRYRELGAFAVLCLVGNAIALLPTGPRATVAAYADAIKHVEDYGNINYPNALYVLSPYMDSHPESPLRSHFPPDRPGNFFVGERIDVKFLLSAWTPTLDLAIKLSLGVQVVALITIAIWLWRTPARRVQDRIYLSMVFVTLMNASLLVVYHQRYDALALIPSSYVALAALLRSRRDLGAWATLCLCLGFAYILSAGMVGRYHSLVAQTGWLFLTPISAYLTLAIQIATIAMMRFYRKQEELPLNR